MGKQSLSLIGSSIVALMAPVFSASAQTTSDDAAEIVVTGSRLREESVQKAPVAVSVISSKIIEQLHQSNISGLSGLAPNLSAQTLPSTPGATALFLRGFGTNVSDVSSEPGVSVYVDSVYQALDVGALANLFDTERVEVLRGPQSTLLGKNAAAGAILVTRVRPNSREFSAKTEAEFGSDNLRQIQGVVNLPIVQNVLGAKLFGVVRKRDGYIDNLVPGKKDSASEDSWTLRGSVLFTPTSDINLYISADYLHDNPRVAVGRNITPNTGTPCKVFSLCTNLVGRRRVATSDLDTKSIAKDWSVVANLDWTVGPGKITSISTYRHRWSNNFYDVDAGPLPLLEVIDNTTQYSTKSQEVRFSSIDGGGWDLDGRLAWLVAAYYLDFKGFDDFPFFSQGSPTGTPSFSNQSNDSHRKTYAVFSHIDFNVTDKLTTSFGIRRQTDKIRHQFSLRVLGLAPPATPFSQSVTQRSTTMEAGAQYQLDSEKMVYVRYAEGFRGGGFNGRPPSVAASTGFAPERSKSWEVGAKTQFFNRKLLVNLTYFDVRFKGLQRTSIVPFGAGFLSIVANIASARTRGVELETVVRPVEGLTLRGALGYLDAKYLSFVDNGVDQSGQAFPYAQKWTGNLSASYETAVELGLFDRLSLQGNVTYRSGGYQSPTVTQPLFFQPRYATVDLQVTFSNEQRQYSITPYVQNLGGKDVLLHASQVGAGPTALLVVDNPGRRIGVTLRKQF